LLPLYTQVAIAKIIGQNKNDIWLLLGKGNCSKNAAIERNAYFFIEGLSKTFLQRNGV
jgi:hypothetical protein